MEAGVEKIAVDSELHVGLVWSYITIVMAD